MQSWQSFAEHVPVVSVGHIDGQITAQTSPEFALNMLEMRQTPGGICKWASKYDSGGFKENWKNVFCVEDHRFWYFAWAMPYIRSRSMKNVLGSRRGHRTGDGRGIYRVV